MLVARTALGFVLASFLICAPAIAADNCTKLPEKDQAECWWAQADDLSEEILETTIAKCKKMEKRETDQAFCTAFVMALLLKEIENAKVPRR